MLAMCAILTAARHSWCLHRQNRDHTDSGIGLPASPFAEQSPVARFTNDPRSTRMSAPGAQSGLDAGLVGTSQHSVGPGSSLVFLGEACLVSSYPQHPVTR